MAAELAVVGVGASAGGLEPICELMQAFRPTVKAAFVIVQHLSPEHPSLMPELLSRRTRLSVELATDKIALKAGCCYLMPPGAAVRVEGDVLRVEPYQGGRHALPIDTFFTSLAKARGKRAIAVVLSGTGSDGAQGAARVRAAGGRVVVQDPVSAQFDGMPRSVVDRGLADVVCLSTEVPAYLEDLLDPSDDVGPAAEFEDWVLEIIARTKSHVGIDLSEYKATTFQRRLKRRMEELRIREPAKYLARIDEQPAELDALLNELLIDVTSFFRDPGAFEQLREDILPSILDHGSHELRLWSAGCASGHEAYTLAVIVEEALRERNDPRGFKIFATDANDQALSHAGHGWYAANDVAPIPRPLLDRYFKPESGGYRVIEPLRRRIVFANHNLQRDPPFTQVDLIACRNVLIYFRPRLQHRLLALFHFALRPEGFLFLGDSETAAELEGAFKSHGEPRNRFYRRVGTRTLVTGFPQMAPRRLERTPGGVERRQQYEAAAQLLLRSFAPPAVLVDEVGDALHLFGDCGQFLTLPEGVVSRRLDHLARGPLAAAVATVLAQARRDERPVAYGGISVPGIEGLVRVSARSVPATTHYLLTFHVDAAPEKMDAGPAPSLARVDDLHRELLTTRESLQATIEELQTANEELQAANEEMLAANEELQATNEELHATNEELHTVNAERQERIQELIQLNEDIDNLLRGTGQATVFLDASLRVRRYTGPIKPFIRLMPQDVGRPISDFANSLNGVDLESMAMEVLDTNEHISREARVGASVVQVQALPYAVSYKGSAQAGGVVFHFTDITDLKRAEVRLDGVLNSLPQHIAVLDGSGNISHVNDAWRRFAKQHDGSDQLGANYIAAAERDPSAATVANGVREVINGKRSVFTAEYPCDTPAEPLRFLMHATPLRTEIDSFGAVVTHQDITSRSLLEEELRRTQRRYKRLFDTYLDALLLVDVNGLRILDANASAAQLLKRKTPVLLGSSIQVLVPEGRIDVWQRAVNDAQAMSKSGTTPVRVLELITGSGADESVTATFLPFEAIDGKQTVLIELRSFHQPTAVREGRAETTARRAERLEALGTLAGGVAHEMNNVLAVIMGLVESWVDGDGISTELARDLEEVLTSCRRGRDVTRNLLGFARADAVSEPFRLDEVVGEIMSALQRMDLPDIEVVHELERGITLIGDRSQLAQALLNLSLNGIDAMRAGGGQLRVQVGRRSTGERDEVVITVSDSGEGMTPDVQARAFEPFFTTKPRGAGTGLGLPLVYGLVRGMGGFIDLSSTLGEGTVVSMVLPLRRDAPDASDLQPKRPRTKLATLRGRVLIVDDDGPVRRSVGRLLRRMGLEVSEVEDGVSALKLTRAEAFDLMVLDLVMPNMDGIEVLRRLREVHPTLPVLICSGYPERADGQLDAFGPNTGFVYKPVGFAELDRELRKLLVAVH